MKRYLVTLMVSTLSLYGLAAAGDNPNAKVAVHVKAHYSKQSCGNLPAIAECSDISTTYPGSSVDFFPVFFNLVEYRSVEYAVSWPSWTYSCAFTSCADLVIGDIQWPGDGMSHAWTECQSGPVAIPGWGWLYADSSGLICIVGHPQTEVIAVLDCHQNVDEPIDNFCAGVYGATGEDPCGGRRGEEQEGGGTSGGIRGYYRP